MLKGTPLTKTFPTFFPLRDRLEKKLKTIQILKNWLPIWLANRNFQKMPPLEFRKGHVLYHRPNDIPWPLFCEIFLEDCYGSKDFYTPQPGDTIVDVGANIGTFALYINWLEPTSKVYSFEPSQGTREQLQVNVEKNHLSETTQVFPFGVYSTESELELFVNPISGNQSLFKGAGEKGSQKEKIKLLSLIQILEKVTEPTIHLLKMDVEGAEKDAFETCTSETFQRVQRVAIEYHDNLKPGTQAFLVKKLTDLGLSWIRVLPHQGGIGIIQAARSAPRKP